MNFKGIAPIKQAAFDTELNTLLNKVANGTTRAQIRERLNSASEDDQLLGFIQLLNNITWPASQQG